MNIQELDCVRLTAPVTGQALFGEGECTLPAGAEGCAISVFWDACEVEFDDNIVLTVPFDKLIKYWDVASQQYVA